MLLERRKHVNGGVIMLITGGSNSIAATHTYKSGNVLPPGTANNQPNAERPVSIRELANSIDPTNMSRNEALAIAGALGQAGDLELSNAFVLQGLALVNDGGGLRQATATDAIMNEKFNMFDAIKSNMAFNQSQGLPTDHLEKGLEFLAKFQQLRESPEVDLYA